MANRITEMTAASTLDGAELVEISQLSPSITIAAATISAASSDNSFNDSGSGFVAAGFAEGDRVRVEGFANSLNNLFFGVIESLTTGKMIIASPEGDSVADEAAGASVVISKWTTRRTSAQDIADLGSGGGGGGAVAVDDSGSEILAAASRLNFTGAGVTVMDLGSGEAGIDIPGGGGGGSSATPMHGQTGSVPALADFTQINMTGITLVEAAGKAIIFPRGTGTGIQLLAKTAPASPYRIAIAMNRITQNDRMRLCAGWRDPGTSRLTVMLMTAGTIFIQGYNNETSYSGMLTFDTSSLNLSTVWFGLRRDATHLHHEISTDGVTFITLWSEPLTGGWLASPSQVWAGINHNSGGVEAVVLHTWDEDGLSRAYA